MKFNFCTLSPFLLQSVDLLQLVSVVCTAKRVVQLSRGGRNVGAAQVQLLFRLATGAGPLPNPKLPPLGGETLSGVGLSSAGFVQQHVPIYDADVVGHRAEPQAKSPARMGWLWVTDQIAQLHLPVQYGFE